MIGSLTLPANTSCPLVNATADCYNRTINLYQACQDKFCNIITQIDGDEFSGNTRDLSILLPQQTDDTFDLNDLYNSERRLVHFSQPDHGSRSRPSQQKSVDVFTKLTYYLNSTLPASLPPLQLYIPTYPLLCLAAEYASTAYLSPRSAAEKKYFVSADGRTGSKAMVVKSVPVDDRRTIVFAIRGTGMTSFRDWMINLKTEPASPTGFLDDEGNLCHAGFLKVAKAMVRPIAARLRQILQENPDRMSNSSLLITGHSAGGAIASLLFCHMLSPTVQSELTMLKGCFKRVHCVTFGAPPVTLLPLQKPDSADPRMRKCLFYSFINEGDPVVRAEPAYIRSLLDLLAAPIPGQSDSAQQQKLKSKSSLAKLGLGASMSRLDLSLMPSSKTIKSKPSKHDLRLQNSTQKLWWDVPPATLSNAGRLVVLRVSSETSNKSRKRTDGRNRQEDSIEGVGAYVANDEDLRRVIFGDPIMHQMSIYRRRIEALACRAVTGKLGR